MTDREKVLKVLNERNCKEWVCDDCPLSVGYESCNSGVSLLTGRHNDDSSISECNKWLADNPEQVPEPGFQEDTRKSDKGKTKYQFLMRDLAVQVEGMCKILTRGEERYSARSWMESTKPLAYLDACYRHIAAWNKGERLDSDSGQSHLLHAAINLMFLDWFDKRNSKDD